MLWFSWWKPSGHPRLSGCHPSYGGTRVGNNNQEWAKQGSSRLWDEVRSPIRKSSKDPGLHIHCWQADFLYMFTECCIRACSNIKITYMFLDVNDIATGAGVVCRRFQGGVITLSKIFKLKIIDHWMTCYCPQPTDRWSRDLSAGHWRRLHLRFPSIFGCHQQMMLRMRKQCCYQYR